ncbi:CBS domain-containing protein [Hazenella coriacea]|uniref:CBS domain-containing protein n=1 Tax=Hazenella coriacea TaxID=1179467 RepID=A0A4R3L7F0_9BACL|nr:CBS domain-containing protein [Hazenella coriacea]TCS95028.1 CBS domain-containing protein [Hazenella coriacea]
MSQLKDIMSKDVAYVAPNDNVYEAASRMRSQNVGLMPVVDQGELKGVVTDRDIVVRGIAEKKPNSIQVQDVMSSQLVTGSPQMSVDEAAQLMADAQVRRLPIVDNNQLVGIVSLKDMAVRAPYQNEASQALNEISETHQANASNDILQ